jgi:hypothetical protein
MFAPGLGPGGFCEAINAPLLPVAGKRGDLNFDFPETT